MVFIASLWDEKLRVLDFKVEFEWHNYLFCRTPEALSNLRDGVVKQFLVCFVEFPLVFVGETLVYGTIHDVDIVDISVLPCIVVDDSKHVDICDGVAYDFALCRKIIQCVDALLVFFGLLKL